MFVFKKLIKPFFLPPMIVIILVLYGLSCVNRRKKKGSILILTGVMILYLLSISPVTNLIIKPLEMRYHPVKMIAQNAPSVIVVLAGGARVNNKFPVTSALKCSSMARILEAYRLYKMVKSPEIIIVGGSGDPLVNFEESKKMKELMLMLGASRKRVRIEMESRDTYENMGAIKKALKTTPFWLVTSAMHMPRAMFLAGKFGLKAFPAPCDSQYNQATGLTSFVPDPYNFHTSTAAMNEYLGLIWYKFAWWVGIK